MEDQDFVDGDDMGTIDASLTEANGWDIGTHTARSIHGDGSPGDYSATWEIRRAPLPDLMNRGIRLLQTADGQFYCVTVQNIGEQSAEAVPLAVRADGVLVRAPTFGPLDVGQSVDHCVLRTELPAGEHLLSFTVDQQRQIPEMDERNNFYEWRIPARTAAAGAEAGPVAAPSPQPTGPQGDPNGAQPGHTEDQADLTVRAIRVNGQAPDGKDDCKVGKNAVSVVVKNAGKGDAGTFTVRLAVDGNNVDAAVDNLDAGQEREIRFDDVPLKAGGHTLRAVADPEHAISESKEENNELKATARCQG
jgi:hypothetical protein